MPHAVIRRLSISFVDGFLSQLLPYQRRHYAVRAAKKSVVFLGTPSVAATSLETLLNEAAKDDSLFEITAVVSQPNKPIGRKNRRVPSPTPVSAIALEHGFVPDSTLLTPSKARNEMLLSKLEAMSPDLCITAAYGNLLPSRFLRIPSFGTLNIHPSLLPKYRGAAPVNRALEDGVRRTGVSIVYTVDELDAGPILATRTIDVDLDIQAPELLDSLFSVGTRLLIDLLPSVFNGQAVYTKQNDDEASYAPKMKPAESMLHFQSTALELHNKVRAFTPWPGTRAMFKVFNTLNSTFSDLELLILRTRLPEEEFDSLNFYQGIRFIRRKRLLLQCGENTVLEILTIQKPGGKPLTVGDFNNGIAKRHFLTLP